MTKQYSSIAKITRPALPKVVPRQRLFKLLDERRHYPLTWITGPPGSGKTTLVASYLNARKLPCLWYQMDPGDSDIATFFYYMGMAAKKVAPRTRKPLPLLTPEYLLDAPTFTQRYFESLCSRLKPLFFLVFDNYQEVPQESPFHEMLRAGLSRVPESIQVIVMSRAEHPPAFTGMLADNRMNVIGWDEIKFTPAESSGMMRLHVKKRQDKETISWVHEKTQGWAAGLVLVAKAMSAEPLDPQTVSAIAPAKVFDYFANELFEKRTDEATRDFLLKTAFLPKITPSLAEELTGSKDAGRILSDLSRMNYFTERRLDRELHYQYHPLFREFLLSRARQTFSAEAIAGVRHAAAKLLEACGQVEDAADLYIMTKQGDALAALALNHARELISQGRSRTLLQWLTSLPRDMMEQSPWLLYWTGICHFPLNYAESRRYFERAFRLFDASRDALGVLLAWSAAVDTIIYEGRNLKQLEPWIAWFRGSERKRESYPSPDVEFRAVTSMTVALMFSGKGYDDIAPWVGRAMRLMHACSDRNAQIQSGPYFAIFYLWRGELNTVGELVKDQKRWGKAAGVTPLSTACANYTEAMHHWIMAYPDFGIGAISEGMAVTAAHGIHSIDNHLIAQKLIGALAKGDLALAEDLLRLIESMTGDPEKRYLIYYHYSFLPALKSLLDADFSAAYHQSLDSLRLLDEIGGSLYLRTLSNIIAGQALLCLGEHDKARKHIREVRRIASDLHSPLFEFSGLLLEAQVFLMQKGPSDAAGASDSVPPRKRKPRGAAGTRQGIAVLRRALAVGRSRGYLNTVIWYAPVVVSLCITALEHGIETEYVRELIRKHNLNPFDAIAECEVRDAESIAQRAKGKPHAPCPMPDACQLENWPWPIKIYTLGRFRVIRDDKPLNFSGRVHGKPLEMLKAMIAFGGKDVREEPIVDALWPDAEGHVGHTSFKTTLHRLRQLLGREDAIQVQKGRVTLDPRYFWVDAWAFDMLLPSAEEQLRISDFGFRIQNAKEHKQKSAIHNPQSAIEKAISLYHGHFLSGEEAMPWVVSMQERLKEKFLRAVETLGSFWEERGEHKKAVECYQQGLDIDDLAEGLYQRLIACYGRMGRRADAVKAYERCRKTLSAVFGVEPSEETGVLYKKIVGK